MPGASVCITTCGGANSGNTSTGMRCNAYPPMTNNANVATTTIRRLLSDQEIRRLNMSLVCWLCLTSGQPHGVDLPLPLHDDLVARHQTVGHLAVLVVACANRDVDAVKRVALPDKHEFLAIGFNDRAVGDGQSRIVAAQNQAGRSKHVRLEQTLRIFKLYPNLDRAARRIEIRLDQRDLPGKDLLLIAQEPDVSVLPETDLLKVLFIHLGNHDHVGAIADMKDLRVGLDGL